VRCDLKKSGAKRKTIFSPVLSCAAARKTVHLENTTAAWQLQRRGPWSTDTAAGAAAFSWPE
jgi:hypothetical protein